MYTYNAHIVSVYDGDTVRADIDLGFGIHTHNVILRLHGINAPEMRGPDAALGADAKLALMDKIIGQDVLLTTTKDKQEKYGRYLAEITTAGGLNVNQWMVDNGFAVRYMAAMEPT